MTDIPDKENIQMYSDNESPKQINYLEKHFFVTRKENKQKVYL
jgi:hypothetical protein